MPEAGLNSTTLSFFGALSYGGLVVNQRVPRELVEVLMALVILFAITTRPLLERVARRLA